MFFIVGDPQTFDFARVHYPKRMSFLGREGRSYNKFRMATLDQRDLVKCVRKFRTLDDELKTVNSRVSKLREDKKFVESEMSDILKRTAFQGINEGGVAPPVGVDCTSIEVLSPTALPLNLVLYMHQRTFESSFEYPHV